VDGYVLSFPSVSASGASSLEGYLFIGTNALTDLGLTTTPFPVTVTENTVTASGFTDGTFDVTADSHTYFAFADSGTNVYLLDQSMSSSLSVCSNNASFFCPVSSLLLNLIFPSGSTAQINIATITASSNTLVFPDLAGVSFASVGSDPLVILGLPFFYGRNMVYVFPDQQSAAYGQKGPLLGF
jgi:hypothetical protein